MHRARVKLLVRLVWFALAFLSFGCGAASEPAPRPASQQVAVAQGRPDSPIEVEEGAIPITAQDPTWGSRTALVTVVELADFQCPYCARSSATIEQLKREYGPEKLRVVWKNLPLPFHPEAKPAAEVGAAVMALGGNEAFWRFHDKAFANQLTLSSSAYEEWAKDAGVDATALRRALDGGAPRAKVEADMALGKRLEQNGAPAFFINGTLLVGAQPLDKFKSIVDVELEKARTKLREGIPADKLHATLVAENMARRPPAGEDDDEPIDTRIYKVPVGTSPVRGATSVGALVTIIVFSDFECPFCKRAEKTLVELETRYPGAIRVVWKDLPLPNHKRAEPAAELAREARAQKGDAAFWDAHKKLFEASPALDDSDLERIAKELSLDVKRTMAALKAHKHKPSIDADVALSEDFEAHGTPHFFVNGRRVVGALPLDRFVPVVDAELARAKAAVAAGTPPKDVYDALLKDGIAASEPEKATIRLADKAPASGPASAPITMHVFSDFQCPFCSRVEPTITDLKKQYGAKLRVVWRNLPLPFHDKAPLAAEAALEAQAQKGDAAFWKMHALLFENQRVVGGLERDALEGYANRLGLDAKKFSAALDGGTHKKRIEEDKEAANAAGFSGTPTSVIVKSAPGGSATGYVVSGAQPIGKFKKVIDRVLADVKAPRKSP